MPPKSPARSATAPRYPAPRYPARERLVARQAGGDAPLDAGAATGLDRPRLTDEALAPAPRPAPAAARPSRRRAWIVALVLAAATLALFAWRMA